MPFPFGRRRPVAPGQGQGMRDVLREMRRAPGADPTPPPNPGQPFPQDVNKGTGKPISRGGRPLANRVPTSGRHGPPLPKGTVGGVPINPTPPPAPPPPGNAPQQQQNIGKTVRAAARVAPQVAQAAGIGGKGGGGNQGGGKGPTLTMGPSPQSKRYTAAANAINALPTDDGGGGVNRHIIVAVVVIGAIGYLNAVLHGRPVTRVVVGAVLLLIFLSILDVFGGPLSSIASALAMLAMVASIVIEGPPVLAALNSGKIGVIPTPPVLP